jgi:hypothetical protein
MPKQESDPLERALKVAGEILVLPGASLLADGKVKPGLIHLGVGIVAGLTLGAPASLLVAANSLAMSFTGKNLATALFKPGDTRDFRLAEKVKEDIQQGRTLDEIQEEVREDIEDIYVEADRDRPKKTGPIP